MSRVGHNPINIPGGVEVNIENNLISVKGPKGKLQRKIPEPMEISIEGSKLIVKRPSDKREHKALHGLTRALINNMVKGVTEGFRKVLELNGVGYRAAKQGSKLVLTVGYSHPVELIPEDGVEVEVPTPTQIIITGSDNEKVGSFAATVRKVREPDPYKGKGIKYENEKIMRKVGKAAAK